jgi:two-component system response regulator AtoC
MLETADHDDHGAHANIAQLGDALGLVICGHDGPRTLRLPLGVSLTVGRHASCDVALADLTLSRHHARFERRGSSVMVEDLGSRNGVWLSGRRVERAELGLGGSVRLGEVVAAVTRLSPEPKPGAAKLEPAITSELLGEGESMRTMRKLLARAASSELPVVLLGETGTGKELAAHDLHRQSTRRAGPLRVLNCAAIPAHLIESTLFGHERGAFTGADRPRAGIFEEAKGGTVFLDEVGELSLPAQAALLRVLETGRVCRIGSHREIGVDARIVSATHRDLHAMAARAEFRFDILHRLCVIAIELPPLRERREEIATLARHFLAQGEGVRAIDPRAVSKLEEYAWPGNVRELRNVVLRASALAAGDCIGVDDLPDNVRGIARITETMTLGAPRAAAALDETALRTRLKSVEREELLRALSAAGGNRRRAAALLSLPLRTFERRLSALRKCSETRPE